MKNRCTDRGGRGCPCAWHAQMRVYHREHARQQRAAKAAVKRMSARTCPRKFGRFGVCGAVLESHTENGRLVVSCPACERMARGICRDCPRPVEGTKRYARRCAACKAKALVAATRKFTENNRALVNKRARDSYRTSEAERQRRIEYKRAWRAANPDKVKAQKQREQSRRSERRDAYHAAYREQHRVRIANAQRARYHGATKLRTCLACRKVVVTHKKKKCTRCKEAARLAAQHALAARSRSRAA